MTLQGGCHCGAVRYEVSGEAKHIALCHCNDCRKSSGAPMVSWAAFSEDEFTVTKGEVTTFNSSGKTIRGFCAKCGTGISYRNEDFLPASSISNRLRSMIQRALRPLSISKPPSDWAGWKRCMKFRHSSAFQRRIDRLFSGVKA